VSIGYVYNSIRDDNLFVNVELIHASVTKPIDMSHSLFSENNTLSSSLLLNKQLIEKKNHSFIICTKTHENLLCIRI